MDVARPKLFTKGRSVSSVTRCRPQLGHQPQPRRAYISSETSCRKNWLRLVIQTFFAIITVTSFILIVLISIRNPQPGPALRPSVPLRCQIQGCRVICHETPYFENYKEDIIYSIMEADLKCRRVYLELNKPSFINGTLPNAWLSGLRHEVYQLSIFGGNLMYIPSGAFISQFSGSIKTLLFQNIRLMAMEPTSLVGLSNLRTFHIINCVIHEVQQHALKAIDDTLETLTITGSGEWDPKDFTGSRQLEKLTIVDFSYNDFNQILNRESFVGLKHTKILYLNHCKIISIGSGTFDHLNSIEVLYMNNNLLSTVPPGLFDVIVPHNNPRPRINLQDNYWYCDCSVDDLRQLVRKEILLVDTKCTDPEEFAALSFTRFDYSCNYESTNTLNDSSLVNNYAAYENNRNLQQEERKSDIFYTEAVYIDGNSCKKNTNIENETVNIISPVRNNACFSRKFRNLDLNHLKDRHFHNLHGNKWLRFSYFFATNNYSVIQMGAVQDKKHFGFIWYQPICPHRVYCLDVIPSYLKVYNSDPSVQYRFCPVYTKNASVDDEECIDVFVNETETSENNLNSIRVTLYIIILVLGLCFGAVTVYTLIVKKPTLLKSNRILFVKNKDIDALVMPPKLPQRNKMAKDVFTLTSCNNDTLKLPDLKSVKSFSGKSESPSYITAMQPTEDQLAEWRIKHHFNNELTISSRKSELSTLSWIDTTYYYSLDDGDRTYESLK